LRHPEPVFERIAAIERVHSERLNRLRERAGVGDVRHIGSVGAIELDVADPGYLSALRPEALRILFAPGSPAEAARQCGVRPGRHNAISYAELNFVYDIIAKNLCR